MIPKLGLMIDKKKIWTKSLQYANRPYLCSRREIAIGGPNRPDNYSGHNLIHCSECRSSPVTPMSFYSTCDSEFNLMK
jgi:hypothetical protein